MFLTVEIENIYSECADDLCDEYIEDSAEKVVDNQISVEKDRFLSYMSRASCRRTESSAPIKPKLALVANIAIVGITPRGAS